MDSQTPTGISALFDRSRRATALLALASAAIGAPALLAPTASARSARASTGAAALTGATTAAPTISESAPASTWASATTPAGVSGLAVEANVVALNEPLEASGDGITLTLADFGTLHRILKLTGSSPAADAGATINIQVTPTTGPQTWTQAASATIGSTGTYSAVWAPTQSTTVSVRAVLATALTADPETGTSSTGGGALSNASAAVASNPTLSATGAVTLPVFEDSIATFYGPGLWGRRTACGEVLRRATLGVASRTLGCGTMVAVDYAGREVSVPVIDRGPFANHAGWDLTMATARLLGMRETEMVGTLSPAPSTLLAAVSAHR